MSTLVSPNDMQKPTGIVNLQNQISMEEKAGVNVTLFM